MRGRQPCGFSEGAAWIAASCSSQPPSPPWPPLSRRRADFVAAGISSSSFYSYLKAGSAGTPLAPPTATPQVFDAIIRGHNPDLAYVDHDAQGYASAVVTPTSLVVTFTKVQGLNADGTAPTSPLAKRTRITLLEGSTLPMVEDNV